jgi:benzoyl-CoA reductase/2-hydroxyglutaryl-CoA dehydratase subunit BcrC/BadD/HgdB
MHVLELPQKSDDPDAFAHWLCEIRKLKAELERRFGVEITAERLREAVATMNRERFLRRQLAGFMRADAPPLTGRQLLDLKSIISGMPDLLSELAAAVAKLATSPPLPDAKRRVRVLLTGVPVVHGAERVVNLIEDHGGLIVAMENCTGLKPIMDDIPPDAPDPLQAIAEHYWHLPCSVMTHNDRRLDLLRQLTREYRPDCIIELVWQACLTYDVESARVRRLAEEELAIPYLRISTDYAPSDSARLTVRIEALHETVRGNRR